MKIFLILFISFSFLSCKSQQNSSITQYQKFPSSSVCPDNTICTVEIIPNSSLEIKTDNFDRMYAIVEKGKHVVFKYSYKKNTDKQYLDGHYIEEVYAEFDSDFSEMTLKDEELSNVKLLFNRLCYCKGSTGFYKIKNGELVIKKNKKNSYTINLDFKIEEVPQVVTSISETLIIK